MTVQSVLGSAVWFFSRLVWGSVGLLSSVSSTGLDGLNGLKFLAVGASFLWVFFGSSLQGKDKTDLLYIMVSGQHFKRTKGISRHLGDWVEGLR